MASKINADEFVDREGEGKPTLPKGVVLSGVTTITTAVVAENEVANSTGINAGIITSTHFKGNLTGDVNAGIVTVTSQTVVGSAVTISASGIDIGAGVITATSYAGSGANLTGVGATIMVWEYNPDPGDMIVPVATGIGITFNQKIKAGSGNITLRETNASGTVVENFGIGSSVTISNNELSISPTSNLSDGQLYHLSYPSGVITNMAGDNYVGTAYTFKSLGYNYNLFGWGDNNRGTLGQNSLVKYSSAVQIPGTTWKQIGSSSYNVSAVKTDGTLWAWGENVKGAFGIPSYTDNYQISSPVQVGSDTTWVVVKVDPTAANSSTLSVKTDGTLWMWGYNNHGTLGQNSTVSYSSPVQVGSDTTWKSGDYELSTAQKGAVAIKTDGTMWSWGYNSDGKLGHNEAPSGPWYNPVHKSKSSPVQLPGTNWSKVTAQTSNMIATKTDGTLWVWGNNQYGQLAKNNTTSYSSPVQIPGTSWNNIISSGYSSSFMGATKTDGTLWMWGHNVGGNLGQNNKTYYSSPVQIPGTSWSYILSPSNNQITAYKTDGTLWTWGNFYNGSGGINSTHPAFRSSPVQIPGNWENLMPTKGCSTRYGHLVIDKEEV